MRAMSATSGTARINIYGVNAIAKHLGTPVLTGLPLFIAAGTTDWVWGGVFVALTFVGWLGLTLALIRWNRELLNERGRRQSISKQWDKVLLSIYALDLFAVPIVAGLDRRNGWTETFPLGLNLIGCAALLAGFYLLAWSMVVNRHFEVTVFTQDAQQVISSGPYHYVRHPGYVGVILQFLAAPLVLGSWTTMIPALIGALVFVARTALEDRDLHAELPGYADFARRTRYRLLPGVW